MKKKLVGIVAVLLLCAFACQNVMAAAATAAVNTPSKSGLKANYGVFTNTIIYAGTIVALNSSGYAVPAGNTAGHVVVGRASKTVDNRTNASGAGDSGALTIDVERGVFGWAQTGTAISDTSIGGMAYVFDDNHVTNAAPSQAIIAGTIVDFSDGYVWVDTFSIPRTAGSFTTLSASGATSLGATTVNGSGLTVTNNATITKNGSVGGTFDVTGVGTFASHQIVNGNLTVVGSTTSTGTVTAVGAVDVGTTLDVDGLSTLGNVKVLTNSILNGTLTIVGNTTATGTVNSVAGYKYNGVTGFTGVITNKGAGNTSVVYYAVGIITNVTVDVP